VCQSGFRGRGFGAGQQINAAARFRIQRVLLGDFHRLLIKLGHLFAQCAHALVHLADFALLCAGAEGEKLPSMASFK
jgi:hypothetical protein